GVFDHDDGGVDENPNADGDATQRHDVAGDVEVVHEQKTDQHRHGQRDADDDGRAQVSEDEQDRNRGDDNFLAQGGGDGVNGRFDQAGALVEGNDADALGQARLKLADFFFDG